MKAGRILRRIFHVAGVLLCIILLVVILCKSLELWYEKRGHGNVTAISNVFTESARKLDNPNRGFYHMHGFLITDKETTFTQDVVNRYSQDEGTGLSLVQINLQYYRDGVISERGLENMERLFSELANTDKQFIIRFLYDWHGENREQEPEDLDIILTHMEQVGPILRKYKDKIFTLQGLFAGNWGEMNGTRYTSAEDMQILAKQLETVTDASTYLAVRMPMQWRRITQIGDAAQITAEEDGIPYRLGLYNDGMLGNWSDCGTYGNRTKEEDGCFTYWNREQELAFQEELCKLVPNGGEVIVDNSYNDFENALRDMRRMHVTYLNGDYDSKVLEKWAATTVSREGCFYGMDGLSYIERHLGYRLVIRDAALDYRYMEDVLHATVELQNVGFAPIYKDVAVKLVLESKGNEETQVFVAETDIGTLTGGNLWEETVVIKQEIPLGGRPAGECKVYLCIEDCATGKQILLGNEQDATIKGYLLGTVMLEEAGSLMEEGKRRLKELYGSGN